jgi:hypothetical protein
MRRRFRLKFDLVPTPLWKFNLRSAIYGLGAQRWKTLRQKIVAGSNGKCAICGVQERPHGHEVWQYADGKKHGTATLLRVEIACWSCHAIAHWRNTTRLIVAGKISHQTHLALRKHFRRVNNCRQLDFDRLAQQALTLHAKRSQITWEVDWGPFVAMVNEAKAAREHWHSHHAVNSPLLGDWHALGPNHHMPTSRCASCGSASLISIDLDTSQMSEAEEADYLNGMFGTAVCQVCGSELNWGF